jgi:hypothetical protein
VPNNLLAAFVVWCGGVLCLPMEGVLVHPMVLVTVVSCLALLVQSDEKNVSLFIVQHNMANVSVARVELLIKK